MRILVTSDSHNSPARLIKLIGNYPDIKDIFFLGDGLSDIEKARNIYPEKNYYLVGGNADIVVDAPRHRNMTTLCGKKIFYTHGGSYGLRAGLFRLIRYALMREPDIVFFGHTHVPLIRMIDGVLFVNPGAVGKGRSGPYSTYAIVEITDSGEIEASIHKIMPYQQYILNHSKMLSETYSENDETAENTQETCEGIRP